MSTGTRELIEICEELPEAKGAEVADLSRFLLARQGDERWEALIADAKPRPRLEAFLEESRREAAEIRNSKSEIRKKLEG